MSRFGAVGRSAGEGGSSRNSLGTDGRGLGIHAGDTGQQTAPRRSRSRHGTRSMTVDSGDSPMTQGTVRKRGMSRAVARVPDQELDLVDASGSRQHDFYHLSEFDMDQLRKENMERHIRILARHDNSVRQRNILHVILGLFGLFCTIGAIELKHKNGGEENGATFVLKILTTLSTLGLVASLVHYYFKLQDVGIGQVWFVDDSTQWRQHKRLYLFVEVMLVLIHPPPILDVKEGFGDDRWLGLIMFVRLYLLGRVIRDHTPFYRKRLRLLYDSGIHAAAGAQFHTSLVLKILFFDYMWWYIIVLIWIAMGVFTYCVHTHERLSKPSHEVIDSLWLIVVTMSTVGFGDVVPSSGRARIIIGFASVVGIVLAALLVLVVMEGLQFTSTDDRARKLLRHHQLRQEEKELAASFLQFVWRTYRERKSLMQDMELQEATAVENEAAIGHIPDLMLEEGAGGGDTDQHGRSAAIDGAGVAGARKGRVGPEGRRLQRRNTRVAIIQSSASLGVVLWRARWLFQQRLSDVRRARDNMQFSAYDVLQETNAAVRAIGARFGMSLGSQHHHRGLSIGNQYEPASPRESGVAVQAAAVIARTSGSGGGTGTGGAGSISRSGSTAHLSRVSRTHSVKSIPGSPPQHANMPPLAPSVASMHAMQMGGGGGVLVPVDVQGALTEMREMMLEQAQKTSALQERVDETLQRVNDLVWLESKLDTVSVTLQDLQQEVGSNHEETLTKVRKMEEVILKRIQGQARR